MPKIPDGAKVPADRKPKVKTGEVPECFTFTHDGSTYELAPTLSQLTPGLIRRNRNSNVDLTYTLLEALADPETIAVLDSMTLKDHGKVLAAFSDYVGDLMQVSLGE